MAGDWIKMRSGLLTSPKVNGIARHLERNPDVCKSLSTGYNGVMSDIVTRHVTRYVTVTALLLVWSAANEHTSDGVFVNADLSDIDDIAGIPGFGAAMREAGWLVYDEDACTVTLPNFEEYNTSHRERGASAKTAAERQRQYRERKKQAESGKETVTQSDVTSDVTRYRREEERREEKIEEQKTKQKDPPAARAASLSVAELTELQVDEQVAREFLAIRKKKRAPLTPVALDGIRREAGRANITLDQALRKCIERGWQGFEAGWVTNERSSISNLPNRQEALEARNREVAERLARTI